MGKLLANQIRGINPLAKKGVLLLWAFLLSFACLLTPQGASAATVTYNLNGATSTSVGFDGTTNIVSNAGVSYTSGIAGETNQWRGITSVGIPTATALRNRIRTSAAFTGTKQEIARVYGPVYAATQTISANATTTATMYLATAAANTYLIADIFEYNDTIGIVGSALGTATSTVLTNSTAGQQRTMTFNNPAFNISAGSRLVVIYYFTSAGARPCLLWGTAYNSATPAGYTIFTVTETPYSSSDITKPVVSGFTAPASSTSTLISGITVTATDEVGGSGIAGYLINESATPPLASAIPSGTTPPTTYNATSAGTKTLYVWVKDLAGNVSNLYTPQTCTIVLPTPPTRSANWTSQYASATYPAGTVSNYTVAAGSNRLLVVAIASTRTTVGATAVSNVTWGGKALTLAAGNGALATIYNHTFIYYLKEADIASASGNALTATIAGGTSYYNLIYAAVYTGVDQTTPVTSAALFESNTSNTTVGPFSPTLTVEPQHQAIEIVNLARTATATTARTISAWKTGWTTAGQAPTAIVTSGPTQRVYIRDRALPTATVNDDSLHTASGTAFDSMAAIVINPAGNGLTVSNGSTVPNSTVYTGDTSVAVDAFNVVAAAADTITNITITGSAATNSTNVSAVRIYRKVGADTTKYETGDVLIASGIFTVNSASLTTNEVLGAGAVNNYIVVYDIAANAVPSATATLNGYVSAMTANSITSLADPVGSSATITIHPTTTIGNGFDAGIPAERLYKASTPTKLDSFTLVHNGTATDDDAITYVTVTLTPPGISGSGSVNSKISLVEIVNEAGDIVYGSLNKAITGDIWDVPTPTLFARSTVANYFVRITTAASINPGFYTVGGTITSVTHDKGTSKLVNQDSALLGGTSQTHSIDMELPSNPAAFTAVTTSPAIQPGGKIDLAWTAALIPDGNGGSLNATTPYIVKRSVAGGTAPAEYCTDGTTVPISGFSFTDSGLNDTSGPIYHYRICAIDAQGNISNGITSSAASSDTNYCFETPDVSLGVETAPNSGVIQDQLIKSQGGEPFYLVVTNNNIGTCPNVDFAISLVETATTGGTCVTCDVNDPPPSVNDFTETFPASVLLGRTAGPGGTNKTSASLPIYINGLGSADQIQRFMFKAQVTAPGRPTVTSPVATGILNDMPPIVHNSNNMGKFQYGSWGNTYTCATCHSNSTTNIKGVYEVISTPIGRRNVVFTKTSSLSTDWSGVYGNDTRPNKNVSNNVCSVCHHQTRQHQYSANKATGGPAGYESPYVTDHHNSGDCIKCHTHNTAFRSILGVCGDCHGFKGTNYAPVSKATMVRPPTNALGTNPPSYGAHQAHNNAQMTCDVCHNTTNHGLDSTVWVGDDEIEMGFKIDSTTFPNFNPETPIIGGILDGTDKLNSPYVWKAGPGTTLNIVSNINTSCSTYCHGGWSGNVGSNIYPNWVGTGQAACGTCHNATATTPPVSGSHITHAGNGPTGLNIPCINCHGTYTLAQYTGSKHVNGDVEWSLTATYPGGSYDGKPAGSTSNTAPTDPTFYSVCNNMYCHSNVQGVNGVGGPTTYAVPLWGDNGDESTTVYCGSCHIYPNTVGGHAQHENTDFAFDCHICHNNGGRTSPQNHAKGTINFEFVGLGSNTVYSKGGTVTPGAGYGSCSTSDCHGRYTRVWGPATAITLCEKCHGSSTSARGFYNTRGPDGTLSIYSAAIGVHDIHLQNPNSPRKATFSRFTSFSKGMNCNQCHNVPTGPFSPGHMNDPLPAEMAFNNESSISHNGERFGYYSSPRFKANTCNNVWCHGSGMASNNALGNYSRSIPLVRPQAPTWVQTYGSPTMLSTGNPCIKCHAMPPQVKDATSTHWNQSANRVYTLNECVGCHQHLNNSATGFVNKALHINGVIDGGCTGCHGNPPTAGYIGATDGLATPVQNAMSTSRAGAHDKHAKNANIGNNCYTCHYNYHPDMPSNKLEIGFNAFGGKVTSGTFTGYSSPNGGANWLSTNAGTTVTVVADRANANVCSNLYCHGSSLTSTDPLLTNTTPNWELSEQAACGTCHGADPSNVPQPALSGAHTRHASSLSSGGKVGLGLSCETCHGASAASMAHVNGSVTWELDPANPKIGPNARYNTAPSGSTAALAPSASYATCSTFYCHSNVQGFGGVGLPTTYNTMTWGANTVLTCSSCHLSQVGTGTASHASHTALYGGSVSCGYCHHGAGANTEFHADGMIYVNVTTSKRNDSFYSGSDRMAGSATGYGSCSNIICHGAATITWGANLGTKQCQKCHGSKSAAFVTVTSAQVAPGYGADGIATDGSTAATARRVGAHQRHLTTGVLSTNVKCSECHVKVNSVLDSGHLNYTTASLNFSGRATGNGHTTAVTSRDVNFTIQCSNLWCHTAKSNSGSTPAPVWTTTGMLNETTLSVASCTVCHGFPPKSVGAGGTALSYDHTSIANPTAFPVTTCTSCHNNMTTTGTTYDSIFTTKSMHLNGTIEANINCASCHDYDVNGSTWGGVKNANYAGNNQGIGAHYKHIVYLKAKYGVTLANTDSWTSTGFMRVCGTCHSITEGTDHSTATPTNPRSITFGDNATNPRNFGGTPLYNGTSATSSATNPKTCSNIDCHYKTSPVWSTY